MCPCLTKSKDVQKHQKNMWHFRDMPTFLGLTMEINKNIESNPNVVHYQTMKVWNKRGKESGVIPLGQ